MAKTSRTRNTKELLCAGSGKPALPEPPYGIGLCSVCGLRLTVLDNNTLMRHVPPPAVLVQQAWDGTAYHDVD